MHSACRDSDKLPIRRGDRSGLLLEKNILAPLWQVASGAALGSARGAPCVDPLGFLSSLLRLARPVTVDRETARTAARRHRPIIWASLAAAAQYVDGICHCQRGVGGSSRSGRATAPRRVPHPSRTGECPVVAA
jgi:hypothetical protein